MPNEKITLTNFQHHQTNNNVPRFAVFFYNFWLITGTRVVTAQVSFMGPIITTCRANQSHRTGGRTFYETERRKLGKFSTTVKNNNLAKLAVTRR